MKRILPIILVLAALPFLMTNILRTSPSAQFLIPYTSTEGEKAKESAVKISVKDIVGIWRGDESCKVNSTRNALLSISSNGPDEILIGGFYANNGYIKGSLSGNIITIPKQTAIDADYKVFMEGTIAISPDKSTIICNIEIMADGIQDKCINTYHR